MSIVRNARAFAAGGLFLAIAVAFLILSADLDTGSAARMGPGYFPMALSLVLGAIGLAVMAGALRRDAPAESLLRWDWRALGWVVAAAVLFGLVLRPAGLAVTVFLTVLVASRASPAFTWRGAIAAAVVLAGLASLLFGWLIDLRVALLPGLAE